MRLLYVHTVPVPSQAANSVQVAKMCQAFRVAGAEVTLAVPKAGMGRVSHYKELAKVYGLDEAHSFEIMPLPFPRLPARELLFGVLASLNHGRGSDRIVYTRSVSVASAAAMGGRNVVLEMHVSATAFRQRNIRRLSDLARSPRLIGMVAISDRLRQDYEMRYPALIGRILVAHDGAERASKVVPKALAGDFRVGYVGQLYAGKGMEIISELVKRCPWANFHIVGGLPQDLNYWQAKLAGRTNVTFHGQVPHSETGAFIEGMDVVLAPYLRIVRGVGGGEQNLAEWMSPLKIFEYMSRGKPMIASELDVLREVLRDGENALLRAPEDIGAWAAALDRLRNDETLRHRIGNQAQQDFLSCYTWEQRARSILDAIGAALSHSLSTSRA